MARQDIAGLLTGMPTQRPDPSMNREQWAMAFGQQQADRVGQGLRGLTGGTTAQEQAGIADLKAQERIGTLATSENADELREAARLLQQRGKPLEAARILARIKTTQDAAIKKEKDETAQTGFVQFIATNYPSYLGLATTGSITPSNWAAFIKSEKGGDSSPSQFGATSTFKDEKGNLYFGTQARDPDTGAVTSKLSPIGGAPDKPFGKIEQVGAYGQTASERAGLKVEAAVNTEEGKLFVKRKDEATTDFGAASEGIIIADKMLTALENISTGGFVPANIKLATDALGMTPTDVGQFEILAKQQMIQKLSSFGSMPTEGERRVAEQLVPAIRNSKGLNAALINSYKKEMQRRAAKSEYLMQPEATIDGFNEFTIQQYKVNEDQAKVKNFEDLK